MMTHEEVEAFLAHDVQVWINEMERAYWGKRVRHVCTNNLALRMAREKPTQKAWVSMQPKYGRKK